MAITQSFVDWCSDVNKGFWIPDSYDTETGLPAGPGKLNLFEHQIRILKHVLTPDPITGLFPYSTIVYSAPKKSGKALALDTKIPTPYGWTTMGEVKNGDLIFNDVGKVVRVKAVTEIMNGHDCYSVLFSDGSNIVADGEHVWRVGDRYFGHGETIGEHHLYWGNTTTEEMAKEVVINVGVGKRDNLKRYSIKMPLPLQTMKEDLEVGPYTLGLWLGDGATDGAMITIGADDLEVLEYLKEEGTPLTKYKVNKGSAELYGLTTGTRSKNDRANSISTKLRSMELIGNKHIPMKYLRASFEQRVSLLNGLMDSDGTISKKKGRCEFCVVDEKLAKDFRALLTTLGIKSRMRVSDAKLYGRVIGPRYRIGFQPTKEFPVFKLKRKQERVEFTSSYANRSKLIRVEKITKVDSVPVKCIEVDSESHLYLAGEGMIPTHNSKISAAVAAWYAECADVGMEVYLIANDLESAEGVVYKDIAYHAKKTGYRTLKSEVQMPGGTLIKALAQSYRSVAGTRHGLTIWDELWGYSNRFGTKVLLNNLKWVNVETLKVGDKLVSFDEHTNKKAYRSYKTGTITNVQHLITTALEITLESGKIVTVTPEHKFLVKQGNRHDIIWKRADALNTEHKLMKVLTPWEEDKSWDAAYLAAALDGEGSLSVNPQSLGYSMRFSQKNNEMYAQVVKSAKNLEIDVHSVRNGGGTNQDVLALDFYDKRHIVTALGKVQPRRLMAKFNPDKLGRMTAENWDAIISIKEVEDVQIASITVDCKTYLSDGYCSHNSSESARRCWDELTPIPTIPQSLRFISTYAGFEAQSDLLKEIYLKGVGPEEHDEGQGMPVPGLEDLPCYSNGDLFVYWDHEPRMPWQSDVYYSSQRESLRASAYIRLHTNNWVTTNEEFIPKEWWERATKHFTGPADGWLGHLYYNLPVSIGVDAAIKRDCTAIVGCVHDSNIGKTIMLFHKIWTPIKGEWFDLEATVEAYLLEQSKKFNVISILCDPAHLHQTLTRLKFRGLPVVEYTQSVTNMVKATQQLYDSLKYENLWCYPADDLTKHIQLAVAQTTDTGFRLVKNKSNSKAHMDGAIATALAMQ